MHRMHDFRDGTQYALYRQRQTDAEFVQLVHDYVDSHHVGG